MSIQSVINTFQHLQNGKPAAWLDEQELYAWVDLYRPKPGPKPEPVPDPPKPVEIPPVAGDSRIHIGNHRGRKTYLVKFGADLFIFDQIGEKPDAFAVRGFNFPYEPLPGHIRYKGPETEYGGLVEPKNFKKPKGYRYRLFPDAKANTDRYYEQSALADETMPNLPGRPDTSTTPAELLDIYEGEPKTVTD